MPTTLPSALNEVANTAKAEAKRMLDAARALAEDGSVTLSAAHFAQLAATLSMLAEGVCDAEGCTCMGGAVDGVRFWVSHDQLAREQTRCAELTAQNARYRHALENIALPQDASPERPAEFLGVLKGFGRGDARHLAADALR